jgi:phosphate/sulfate permease
MGNYSKLIGSLVGGLVGFGVAKGLLPADWNTPEMTSALTLILSAVFTFAFPANKPA